MKHFLVSKYLSKKVNIVAVTKDILALLDKYFFGNSLNYKIIEISKLLNLVI